jgi:hypothetical protein
MSRHSRPSPVEAIPPPELVQARLAQLVRERQLLRGLLRLARQKRQAAEREHLQQTGGAA